MQDKLGLWLVFRDEGTSLHTLIYSPAISGPHDTSQEGPQAVNAPGSVQQPKAEQSAHRRGAVTTKSICLEETLAVMVFLLAASRKHIQKIFNSPQVTSHPCVDETADLQRGL